MSKTVSREVIATTRPPNDVLRLIGNFVDSTNVSKEDMKYEFYIALNSDELDIYSDMDDRCREAWKIALVKLSEPGYKPGYKPTEIFNF